MSKNGLIVLTQIDTVMNSWMLLYSHWNIGKQKKDIQVLLQWACNHNQWRFMGWRLLLLLLSKQPQVMRVCIYDNIQFSLHDDAILKTLQSILLGTDLMRLNQLWLVVWVILSSLSLTPNRAAWFLAAVVQDTFQCECVQRRIKPADAQKDPACTTEFPLRFTNKCKHLSSNNRT